MDSTAATTLTAHRVVGEGNIDQRQATLAKADFVIDRPTLGARAGCQVVGEGNIDQRRTTFTHGAIVIHRSTKAGKGVFTEGAVVDKRNIEQAGIALTRLTAIVIHGSTQRAAGARVVSEGDIDQCRAALALRTKVKHGC